MTAIDNREKLHSIVSERIRQVQCAVCGHQSWQPGDVIAPPPSPDAGTVNGGPNFPMIQIVCQECGYVMLFSTLALGLEQVDDELQKPAVGDLGSLGQEQNS